MPKKSKSSAMVAPEANGGRRCVIYTRVSTDDQTRREYSSLESQLDICRSYIRLNAEAGWRELKSIEDGGYSAKNLDRPGMDQLLRMVKQGEVDVVLVYKLDRISRSLPDFYRFWELLDSHGVEFVSATEKFDTTTSTGRLLLNLLMVFAQYEREMTVARTSDKMLERAKRGLWNGGMAAFGYDYDPVGKTIVPNAAERLHVQRIFNDVAGGLSPAEVAKLLRREGTRTKIRTYKRDNKSQTVGGKFFNTDSLKALLRNPAYKGCVAYEDGVYPGVHEALVSEDVWEMAVAAITPKTRHVQRKAEEDKHNHLLKGLLRCGQCGAALTPHPAGKKDKNGEPYLYYNCTSVTKQGADSSCGVRSLPARRFDELVLSLLEELGKHPEVIAETVASLQAKANEALGPLKKRQAEIEAKYRKVSSKLNHMVTLAGNQDAGEFGRVMMLEAKSLAEEKQTLEHDRNQVRMEMGFREQKSVDAESVAQQLADFHTVMGHLTPEEKKELVRLLIREVRVNHYDPETDKFPVGETVLKTKIRTQLYSVNISFYANDLFSRVIRTGVNQFVSPLKWLPG